jgi:TolB-like protein
VEEIFWYLSQLSDRGIRVWFDEGISPGESWSQEIADAIDDAAAFLFFITPASVGSRYCQNEVQYALARRKRIVAVHLEETPLPGGLELNLGASQAILAYRLDRAEVLERLAPALGRSDIATDAGSSPSRRKSRNRHRLYAGLGVGLLLTIVIAVLWNRDGHMAFEETQSIAVLPFNNYVDPAYDYLAHGLADGLITQLSKLPQIQVASRASSFGLKKSLDAGELDMNGLRDRLSVRHILEGSVTPGPSDSFLVSVRIVDVVDDRNVWSGEWDTDQTTILGIQGEIAYQVAGVLMPALEGAEAKRLQSDVTLSNEAYDAYLKGRDALRKPHNQENLLEAERQFERARSLDTNFAGAHVGRCEVQLSRYRLGRDPLSFALAQKACNHALELQPDLWEARLR